jgi:transposase
MQDVHDEPLFCERAAGLDIAKAMVEATIRVPSDTTAGRRQQETRTFGTTRRELESLGDWLACWGVTKAGMEATGDYWKPVVRHEALFDRAGVRGLRRRAVAAA